MIGPLFRVADVFSIRGRGVVVAADIPMSRVDIKLRIGDPIELVRADGSRLLTSVQGIETMSPGNLDRSFAFLVGPEVEKADVEVGAEVWRVEPPAA